MSLKRGLAAVALLLALAACWDYPQSSLEPKTDFAESIHYLYVLIFWITLAILVVVWGILGYILVRFRDRPGAPRPKQIRGHLGMEIAWTVVPAIIVVAIAIPTIQTVFRTQRAPGPDILIVDVIGHRFWWEFRYPDGVVTANDLHLPVGVPVTLRMRSADVIHSFWVPMLGGKRDLNPRVAQPPQAEGEGAFNYLHFTVREPGLYRGQCAEYCGGSHALMGVRVVAQSPFEFQAWKTDWRGPGVDSAAAGGGGAARIELGRRTFQGAACVACHAVQGTPAQGMIGPNLTLFGQRATVAGWLENDPDNLVRWITSPRSVKPGARMPGIAEPGGNFPPTNLSEEQVRAVAEYLYSLGRAPDGAL
ncbi:MAG: cytochrome c oxidase subunit II [Gemmatimonadetes bacterium]|nr:cytochrome c oxidase subunit II [Gemmatimonadota bacterium]